MVLLHVFLAGLALVVHSVQHPHPHRHHPLHRLPSSHSLVQMKAYDDQKKLYDEMKVRVENRIKKLPEQCKLIDKLVNERTNENVFRGSQTADHYFNAALVGERGPKLKYALGENNAFYKFLMDKDFRELVDRTHCKEIRGNDESDACAKCVKEGVVNYGLWTKKKSACYVLLPVSEKYNRKEAVWDCMSLTSAFLNGVTEYRCNRDACIGEWPLLDDVNSVVFGDVQQFFLNLVGAIKGDPKASSWPVQPTLQLLVSAMSDLLVFGRDMSARYRLMTYPKYAILERNKKDDVQGFVKQIDEYVNTELESDKFTTIGAEELYFSVVTLLQTSRSAMHPHVHTHTHFHPHSQLEEKTTRFDLGLGRVGPSIGVGAAQAYLRALLQLEDHDHELSIRRRRCDALPELVEPWLKARKEWEEGEKKGGEEEKKGPPFDIVYPIFQTKDISLSDPLVSPFLVPWLKDTVGEENDFYKLLAEVDSLKIAARWLTAPSIEPPFWESAEPEAAGKCVACMSESKWFVQHDKIWECMTQDEKKKVESTATLLTEHDCIDRWPYLEPVEDTNTALLKPATAVLENLLVTLKTANTEEWPEETAVAILSGVLTALFQFGVEPSVVCRLEKYAEFSAAVGAPEDVVGMVEAFKKGMQALAPEDVLKAITVGAKQILTKVKGF